MTTLWNETRQIEARLQGTAQPGDALVFEAKLMLDNTLADKLIWQQKTYGIIREYGRRQLKDELEQIHHLLFTQPVHHSFAEKIRRLFSKK